MRSHSLDRAMAVILDTTDRDQLADALCHAVSIVCAAKTVALRSSPDATTDDVARHGPPLGLDISALASFVLPDAGTLLIDSPAGDEDTWDSVLLLIDVAAATAERMHSEQLLREQHNQLRSVADGIRGLDAPPRSAVERAAEFASAAASLTSRERDILEEILRGLSNAAIAEELTLSIDTVKTHVKHILQKMGAANRAELIARSG
ncbi:helix-turn-helix transcriptional regulator [Gordonia sp. zg691]|nr:helix-turn-helix transcriptional regulator [Gordonia jinghuaiqii]